MTDFRALCAEQAENVRYLLDCVADGDSDRVAIAECVQHLFFTRAALAQPEGEGPSDQRRPAALAMEPIPVSERLPEDADCLVIPPLGASTFPLRYCWQAREIMHCDQPRLIWDWKLVPHTTDKHWPFTYWLPASTRFLPTTVDPAQPT